MKRHLRTSAAPVPVLTRVRPILRKRPLIKAPQAVVTRIRVGDAILGLAKEACHGLEEGRDRLGEMWEAAHAFMDTRAQREIMRRGGTVMTDARWHMAMVVRRCEEDEPCDDAYADPTGGTVEDEIDAKLAARWLDERIEAMDHRTRCIVRGCLGLDGPAERQEDLATRFSVTTSRIGMILNDALEELRVSWRAGLREAYLLLTYGEPEIVLPPEDVPAPRVVRPAPILTKTSSSPRYFDRVKYDRGALLVTGLRIERIGNDAYQIDGHGPMDADGVARMILDAIGDDEKARKCRRKSIACHDTAIGDAMRWQMQGTAWPTKVADRVFLPIKPFASVDQKEAA